MRNKIWPLVVGFCFIVSPLLGNGMAPTSLPMGMGISLPDWIVGNSPCSVTIRLQSTNATGGLNTCGMFKDGISFSSYGDFQSYLTANSSLLRSQLFGFLGNQNASSVRLRVNATYTGLNSQGIQVSFVLLDMDACLGPTADIAANSYATPTIQSVVLPISGVTKASVQFGNGTTNSIQIAGNSGIVWDSSLANNTGRARVSLTFSDGETVTYTQNGNPILPPVISMVWIPAPPNNPYDWFDPYYDNYYDDGYPYYDDAWYRRYYSYENAWYQWYNSYGWCYGYGYPGYDSYNLFASGSSGADTVVESTTNLVSWTPIGIMSWDSGMNSTVIPISTSDCPLQFFRTGSY
jgi:hypothetical protein